MKHTIECSAAKFGRLCADCELVGFCPNSSCTAFQPEDISAPIIYACRMLGVHLTNELSIPRDDWPNQILRFYYRYLGKIVDDDNNEVFLPSEFLWIDPPEHDRIDPNSIFPTKNIGDWYRHQLMTPPRSAENIYVTKPARWAVIATVFKIVFWEIALTGKIRF